MKKTKKGFRNFRRVFEHKQTLNLPNFTSWQTSLDDPRITIAYVNKSLHWLSKAELSKEEIDKKQRLLYRKTQFRDQLSHHDPSVTDNFCQYCLKIEKFKIKETAKHALWECSSLNNLYKNLAKELKIENHINYPITAKSVIIWDKGKKPN